MRNIRAISLSLALLAGPALADGAPASPFAFIDDLPDIAFMDRVVALNAEAGRTRGASGLYDRTANAVVLIADAGGGQGSGVVISRAEGFIVTNWHVIQNARQLAVFFKPPAGITVEPASMYVPEIVRVDRDADLAILRVRGMPDHVVELPLGDIAEVRVGADVHAIGHPSGELWTYTRGFVSQVRPGYQWQTESGRHAATVIQTQTPINPGNSGGPLMDEDGRVVGINTFVRAQTQGINYAVSVADLRTLLAAANEPPPARPQPSAPPAAKGGVSAPAPAPAPQAGSVPCLSDGIPNGFVGLRASAEGTPMALDCGGPTNMMLYDTNGDGLADVVLIDTNGNGSYNVRVEDVDGDGYLEYWRIDTTGDGVADLEGWDHTRNGRPDKLARVA